MEKRNPCRSITEVSLACLLFSIVPWGISDKPIASLDPASWLSRPNSARTVSRQIALREIRLSFYSESNHFPLPLYIREKKSSWWRMLDDESKIYSQRVGSRLGSYRKKYTTGKRSTRALSVLGKTTAERLDPVIGLDDGSIGEHGVLRTSIPYNASPLLLQLRCRHQPLLHSHTHSLFLSLPLQCAFHRSLILRPVSDLNDAQCAFPGGERVHDSHVCMYSVCVECITRGVRTKDMWSHLFAMSHLAASKRATSRASGLS